MFILHVIYVIIGTKLLKRTSNSIRLKVYFSVPQLIDMVFACVCACFAIALVVGFVVRPNRVRRL